MTGDKAFGGEGDFREDLIDNFSSFEIEFLIDRALRTFLGDSDLWLFGLLKDLRNAIGFSEIGWICSPEDLLLLFPTFRRFEWPSDVSVMVGVGVGRSVWRFVLSLMSMLVQGVVTELLFEFNNGLLATLIIDFDFLLINLTA